MHQKEFPVFDGNSTIGGLVSPSNLVMYKSLLFFFGEFFGNFTVAVSMRRLVFAMKAEN